MTRALAFVAACVALGVALGTALSWWQESYLLSPAEALWKVACQ